MDLDEREPLPPMDPDGRPPRTGEELEVFAQVDPEAGALVALDVEAMEADPGQVAAAGPGRRRPRTRTGRPAATMASASRRTRGSSS